MSKKNKRIEEEINVKLSEVLLPLLNNYEFLKEELDKLRNLPMYERSIKNPDKIRATEAQKLYKDLTSSFLAFSKQISDLTGLTSTGSSNDDISELAKYLKSINEREED